MVGRTFANFRHSFAPARTDAKKADAQLKLNSNPTVKIPPEHIVSKSKADHQSAKTHANRQNLPPSKRTALPDRKSTSKPVELPRADAGTTAAANRQIANLTGKPRKEQSSEKNASQPPEEIAYPRTEDVEIFPFGEETFNHVTIPEDEFSAAAKGFVPSEASSKFEGLVDPSVTARFDKLSKNPSKDMLDAWAKHAEPVAKQSFSDVCKGLSTLPRELAGSAEKWRSGEQSQPGEEPAVTFLTVTDECPATVIRIATLLNEEAFIGKFPPKMQGEVRQLGQQYVELLAKLMDKKGVYQTSRACALIEARQPGFQEIGNPDSSGANKPVVLPERWNEESEDASSSEENKSEGGMSSWSEGETPPSDDPEPPPLVSTGVSRAQSSTALKPQEDLVAHDIPRKYQGVTGNKGKRPEDAPSSASEEEDDSVESPRKNEDLPPPEVTSANLHREEDKQGGVRKEQFIPTYPIQYESESETVSAPEDDPETPRAPPTPAAQQTPSSSASAPKATVPAVAIKGQAAPSKKPLTFGESLKRFVTGQNSSKKSLQQIRKNAFLYSVAQKYGVGAAREIAGRLGERKLTDALQRDMEAMAKAVFLKEPVPLSQNFDDVFMNSLKLAWKGDNTGDYKQVGETALLGVAAMYQQKAGNYSLVRVSKPEARLALSMDFFAKNTEKVSAMAADKQFHTWWKDNHYLRDDKLGELSVFLSHPTQFATRLKLPLDEMADNLRKYAAVKRAGGDEKGSLGGVKHFAGEFLTQSEAQIMLAKKYAEILADPVTIEACPKQHRETLAGLAKAYGELYAEATSPDGMIATVQAFARRVIADPKALADSSLKIMPSLVAPPHPEASKA